MRTLLLRILGPALGALVYVLLRHLGPQPALMAGIVAWMAVWWISEAVPLADNGTDSGREANRRIEFTLVGGVLPQGAPPDAPSQPAPALPDAAKPAPEQPDAAAAPDVDADTSPSVAPKQQTRRPKTRPAQNG